MGIVSAPHRAVETSIQVRYAETDAQRVVYHGNYIIWFEVARTTYCEHAGYPYPRMEAEGSFITVTEARVRYRRAVRYGDIVKVRARMTELKSRGCTFHVRDRPRRTARSPPRARRSISFSTRPAARAPCPTRSRTPSGSSRGSEARGSRPTRRSASSSSARGERWPGRGPRRRRRAGGPASRGGSTYTTAPPSA